MTSLKDLFSACKRLIDFDDLQNELAGRSVGRIARFLPQQGIGPYGDMKKAREKDFQSMLYVLLATDPIYRAAYERVRAKLEAAEVAVSQALDMLSTKIGVAEEEFADLLARAGTLPNGDKVFQARDGRIFTEDGVLISGGEAAAIEWREDAPSHEEYLALRERLDRLEGQRQDVEAYRRDVLRPARERLENRDNPPDLEELEEIERRLDEVKPPEVAAFFMTRASAPHDDMHNYHKNGLNAPAAQSHFDQARAAPLASDELDLTERPNGPGLNGKK